MQAGLCIQESAEAYSRECVGHARLALELTLLYQAHCGGSLLLMCNTRSSLQWQTYERVLRTHDARNKCLHCRMFSTAKLAASTQLRVKSELLVQISRLQDSRFTLVGQCLYHPRF